MLLVLLSTLREIISFLVFWIWNLLLETVYVIFRCRPRKPIRRENILITGTGQGLGRLVAERLAKDKNVLHCVDVATELNEATGQWLREKGTDCTVFTYTCDVGSKEEVKALGKKIAANAPGRHITYLFNIAGIVCGKLFPEQTEEDLEKVMRVNLLGPVYLQKLVYKDMAEKSGHIINISSAAGIAGASRLTSYCASKFALRGFTQALQMELNLQNISHLKLTTVMPIVIKTGLFNEASTRWPRLVPLLEPEWAADQIIIATQEEREQVFLPKIGVPMMWPEHLMSTKVWYSYIEFLGAHTMNTYRRIRPE